MAHVVWLGMYRLHFIDTDTDTDTIWCKKDMMWKVVEN